jgi:hypothetical protein
MAIAAMCRFSAVAEGRPDSAFISTAAYRRSAGTRRASVLKP